MTRIRIGISGWRYKPWRGKFYPEDLRQKDELAYAARQFLTIEINGTFYSLQAAHQNLPANALSFVGAIAYKKRLDRPSPGAAWRRAVFFTRPASDLL
jgi:hypothetical protein